MGEGRIGWHKEEGLYVKIRYNKLGQSCAKLRLS
jgi:hypothetical protein